MGAASDTGLVVDEIWRYPVKSMGGERLAEAAIGALGIDGDRRWGIVDGATGRVLTGRRQPELLLAQARHLGPGRVAITLPDGTETTDDDDLSDWLGRRVALRPADGESRPFDVPDPDERDWFQAGTAEGAWHDSGRARLSLVSHGTIGDWDPRRFRSNLLLRGGGEDGLVAGAVRIGSVVLDVTKPINRCVMVNRPQPGIGADRSVLRTILDERSGQLAIGAVVATPGTMAEGAVVERIGPEPGPEPAPGS